MKPRTIPVGERYGRLVVTIERKPGERVQCRCDCGRQHTVLLQEWGHTQSCGCLRTEKLVARSTRHGMKGTSEYGIWRSMVQRCTNPQVRSWADYGGRGITVTERWLDFVNFYADMGPRPDGLILGRIDIDRGYGPDNCRWVSQAEQNRNRRPMPRRDACHKGHPYTPENTSITPQGKRRCRTCIRERARQSRARRVAA